MEHEVFDLPEVEAPRGAGFLQVVAELLAHDRRDALGELHFQARLDEVPAHDGLRIGPRGAVAPEHLRARGASEQHGGGAVGEEARGDEVALGTVAPLEGEAREFDGDEEDQLVGVKTGVFGGAGDTGRPRRAAEAPDRDPSCVLGEAEAEDQLRVQGRRREPRRRDEEDRTDFIWCGPNPVQRPPRRLLGEVEGVLDVESILLGESVVSLEPLYGHAEVAALYLDVVEDREQPLEVTVPAREHAPGERLSLLLPDAVGWQSAGDGEYPWCVQGSTGRVCVAKSSSASGSGCSQVLRKTYCEIRLRWRLDQSMVGLRCSFGT